MAPAIRRIIFISVPAIAVVYLAGPVLAAAFEVGDRRGPRIYLQPLHELVYLLTWEVTSHGESKPRVARNAPPRPWFYGL